MISDRLKGSEITQFKCHVEMNELYNFIAVYIFIFQIPIPSDKKSFILRSCF